jgi:hypothetical protein
VDDNGWVVEPAPPEQHRPIVEPWSAEASADGWRPGFAPPPAPPAVPVQPAVAEAARVVPIERSSWVRGLAEIVNPWAPREATAYVDPTIVDPWTP